MMVRTARSLFIVGMVSVGLIASSAPRLFADDTLDSPSTAAIQFNRDVLPLLAEHCFVCHGFDKGTRQAGLRLDSLATASSQLGSGARAVVPGQPKESELIRRIESHDPNTRMPPSASGKQLSIAQKRVLRKWIEQGANYETHWAFLPPRTAVPPAATGPIQSAAIASAIDGFIRFQLGRLNAEKVIVPNEAANPITLFRRVTLDLTGLPPTPEEVDRYIEDSRPDAYERLVDRLLASPRLGERWARWWLDLAHYADSDGYLQDFLRPYAWHYRQWVVDALNGDMPWDQFTVEQIAGDLLPNASDSQKIATGFLRNTLSNREGGADLEEYRVLQAIDRANTVSATWMGLTVACAQCHDHKFDAITQREFYQFYAFFNNADEVNIDAPRPGQRESYELALAEYLRQRTELIGKLQTEIDQLQAAWEEKLLWTEAHPGEDHHWDRALEVLGLIWGQGFGEGQLEGLNIIKTPIAKRTDFERRRLQDYFLKHGSAIAPQRFKELELGALPAKLDGLLKTLPELDRAPTMTQSRRARPTHVHERGDFRRLGEEVSPKTFAILPPMPAGDEPDRLRLARWLVSRDHPLTARVVVNRIWQEFFGNGLVASSENFGVRGQLPTHPDLLDWLAVDLVDHDWSIKQVMRQMVLSQTYCQSSSARPELATIDPQNRYLARQSRLRLSAELVRDGALASSGLLCRQIGGPSVRPPQPESVTQEAFDNKWVASGDGDRYRRGLYTFIQRTSPFAQFITFDLPDHCRSCSRRERSNTPLQALALLNDPVFLESAQALANRSLSLGAGKGTDAIIECSVKLALSRPATSDELRRLRQYWEQQKKLFVDDPSAAKVLNSGTATTTTATATAEQAAWVMLSSVLLNLDEAITRE